MGIVALRAQDERVIDTCVVRIFRPLLAYTKSEIIAYAHAHRIDFCEDATNADTTFQRNFLRHEILPKFSTINPEYRRAIGNFIDYIEGIVQLQHTEATEWLQRETHLHATMKARYASLSDDIYAVFSREHFRRLSSLMQGTVIECLYRAIHRTNFGLSEGLVQEVLRFILEGNNSHGMKHIREVVLIRRGDIVMVYASR